MNGGAGCETSEVASVHGAIGDFESCPKLTWLRFSFSAGWRTSQTKSAFSRVFRRQAIRAGLTLRLGAIGRKVAQSAVGSFFIFLRVPRHFRAWNTSDCRNQPEAGEARLAPANKRILARGPSARLYLFGRAARLRSWMRNSAGGSSPVEWNRVPRNPFWFGARCALVSANAQLLT